MRLRSVLSREAVRKLAHLISFPFPTGLPKRGYIQFSLSCPRQILSGQIQTDFQYLFYRSCLPTVIMTKRRPSTQSRAERVLSLTTVWPVCYSTLVVIVHSYLIYQAVSRYKIYATAAPGEAGYHLVLLCIAALLLPVIVLLSFVKTGTYTNDGAPSKFNYRDVVNSFI